jgi:hypothetical protein
MDLLYFQDSPEVEIGGNKFINVPTIIQWEDEPLLQVGKFVEAGYTIKYKVFHSDGTPIAIVKGSQVYITDAGRKAAVKTRSEDKGTLTVCELEGKTILEMRRKHANQLKGWAELHAPEGVLIKVTDRDTSALLGTGGQLVTGNVRTSGSTFEGNQIGIHLTKSGVALGSGGGVIRVGRMQVDGGMQLAGVHVNGTVQVGGSRANQSRPHS